LLIQPKDRVAFATAQNGLEGLTPCRSSFPHLNALTLQMARSPLPGVFEAKLPDALEQLQHRMPRRGMVIVFSDFLEREDEVLRALRSFRIRGDEVVLFHVLHQDELHLPDAGSALLRDSETGQEIPVHNREARKGYHARLQVYLDDMQRQTRKEGFDYSLVSTAEPYYHNLRQYLQERSRVR
jgi:uncharacterized protein (DUF58 family)